MTRIPHRQRQLFEMAELRRSQSEEGGNATSSANASYRSRASSVISTGTKFSISTMPPAQFHIDGVLEGSDRPSTATRPTSLYSVRSMTPSLPPYEGHQPMEAMLAGGPHAHSVAMQTSSLGHDHRTVPSTGSDPQQPPTPSDPESTLSMHYGRIVRTIDENHSRQLARVRLDHEQELASTRNAIDGAYRKEFKAKNREIERVREEAANAMEQVRREAAADVAAMQEEIETLSANHDGIVRGIQRENAERLVTLHAEHQAATEKARHAIEDLWEGRWNDRTRFAAEEAKRSTEAAERRDAERSAEWIKAIKSTHPELLDEIMTCMQIP